MEKSGNKRIFRREFLLGKAQNIFTFTVLFTLTLVYNGNN
jgi:hypothetical protein